MPAYTTPSSAVNVKINHQNHQNIDPTFFSLVSLHPTSLFRLEVDDVDELSTKSASDP
jgi:hypothetical protein